jgi:hypothetical protein
MPIALAWFPADQWPIALERWPDLREDEPEDHVEYSRRMEGRLKSFANVLSGHRSGVAPISVIELEASAGERAGTAEGRAGFAAELCREGRAIAWPPNRNDPCWCGSGRKYKQCCGPEPPAAEAEAE